LVVAAVVVLLMVQVAVLVAQQHSTRVALEL
jgi:hypothetical protein